MKLSSFKNIKKMKSLFSDLSEIKCSEFEKEQMMKPDTSLIKTILNEICFKKRENNENSSKILNDQNSLDFTYFPKEGNLLIDHKHKIFKTHNWTVYLKGSFL
jgi:hypothetical protein